MPRKGKGNGHGGARTGTQGTAYGNRTDLNQNRQPVAAPAGQTYGERGRQEASQRAMPLPDTTGPAMPPSGGGGGGMLEQLAALPGLTDPTTRPGEPIQAGMPTGPGPGPLPQTPRQGAGGNILRGMLAVNPSPELFELVAEADRWGA